MSKLDKILTADEVHLDNPPLPTRENVASMMWGEIYRIMTWQHQQQLWCDLKVDIDRLYNNFTIYLVARVSVYYRMVGSNT